MSATKTSSSLATGSGAASAASVSLEPVFSALRSRVPAARQAQAEAFTRAFYKRMTIDEFVLHSPDAWAVLAADFFEMAHKRLPGHAEVRVFNASLAQHGFESPHTVLQIVN